MRKGVDLTDFLKEFNVTVDSRRIPVRATSNRYPSRIQYNCSCKVMATIAFCIPLLSYGFGIVDWTKAEISQFYVMFCKTVTAGNNLHTIKQALFTPFL